MLPAPDSSVLAQTAAAILIGSGLVLLYRRVAHASCAAGLVLASGLVARAVLGLVLFWLAYLDLPLLRGFRSFDQFWTFALDSGGYVLEAQQAALGGPLRFVGASGMAPDYTEWLSWWMWLVGSSRATAVLMNLTLYAALSFAIVRACRPVNRWREDLPMLALLASVSWSPALLIHGVVPLKDMLCVALLGFACLAAWWAFGHGRTHLRWSRRQAWGLVLLVVSNYFLFGVRNWAASLVAASSAAVLLGPWLLGPAMRVRTAAVVFTGACALGALSLATSHGLLQPAGGTVVRRVEAVVAGAPAGAIDALDQMRNGFDSTGGRTRLSDGRPALSWATRARALAVGLAALFVPATLLRAAGLVSLPGSALLLAADADTLFTVLSIACAVGLLARRSATLRWQGRYVWFVLLLACSTTALMAYVVTNFGTLFRLRLMLSVPVWALGLATSSRERLPEVAAITLEQFTKAGAAHTARVEQADGSQNAHGPVRTGP